VDSSAASPAPEGEVFSQLSREPSLSDRVAESITEAIVSGRLSPGQPLQAERELADRFGVSRTVIREAVRSLAAQGLIEARSGRGLQVAMVGSDAISRSMRLYLRGNASIDYRSVHEVRSALEIQIAGIAAERVTDENLARMAEINERLGQLGVEDPQTAAELDVEFHSEIARATQNDLFLVMLDSIRDVLLEIRHSAFSAPGMVEYAATAHQRILDRLAERDPARARAAMREHLERSDRAWKDVD
jgi:GntR family transcriptional regulator, transcriptional repressor for pyruvate dehydrogenase complex